MRWTDIRRDLNYKHLQSECRLKGVQSHWCALVSSRKNMTHHKVHSKQCKSHFLTAEHVTNNYLLLWTPLGGLAAIATRVNTPATNNIHPIPWMQVRAAWFNQVKSQVHTLTHRHITILQGKQVALSFHSKKLQTCIAEVIVISSFRSHIQFLFQNPGDQSNRRDKHLYVYGNILVTA